MWKSLGFFIVLLAVLLAITPTGAVSAPQQSGAQYEVLIRAEGCFPAIIQPRVGDTVTWMNEDSATHRLVEREWAFDSGDIASGGTYALTCTRRGVYEYGDTEDAAITGTLDVGW